MLADLEIPAGTYSQLRLMVEGARVELATGYAFTSGGTTADLTVPSGAQTGIKLNLKDADAEENQGGVEITGGQTVLVVDFDVNQSFVIQGNAETPAGIKGVLFKPTLRVVVKATPVDGTTLEPYQSLTGSATVDAADGSYTIYYLVPGDYEVSVTVDPGDAGEVFTADPVSVTVGESASVTGVNFVIVQG